MLNTYSAVTFSSRFTTLCIAVTVASLRRHCIKLVAAIFMKAFNRKCHLHTSFSLYFVPIEVYSENQYWYIYVLTRDYFVNRKVLNCYVVIFVFLIINKSFAYSRFHELKVYWTGKHLQTEAELFIFIASVPCHSS